MAYRRWIDQMTSVEDWLIGTAVMTIFVEGSVNDRVEIGRPPEMKTPEQIEAVVDRHHLVRHHGIARDRMDLIRAHQQVEAGHRQAAYGMVLAHARTKDQQERVLEVLASALESWLRYRDGVAAACGLKKPS
jgi:pyrroloquinoline-quinone synthase